MEPLNVDQVLVDTAAQAALHDCWTSVAPKQRDLVGSAEHFERLVKEVLSLDIRSQHQRASGALSEGSEVNALQYNVTLLGIAITYKVADGRVILQGAKRACADAPGAESGEV